MRKKIKKAAHKVKSKVKKGIKKVKKKRCEARDHKWSDEVIYDNKKNQYRFVCHKCGATKKFNPDTKPLKESFTARI